jgi:MFS transporter, NNP family, nitrate/nitrite transporter
MQQLQTISQGDQNRALGLSTIAFTACFAVWTIFSIIGIQIKDELGLNNAQFGLLVGIPILTGSLSRIFLGIWTDQYGGRIVFTTVMVAAAVATLLLARDLSAMYYPFLGVREGHHAASHYNTSEGYERISRFHLFTLKETPAEAEVVKLHYFAGFNISEAARALGIPVSTAHRHWTFARAWLFQRLKDRPADLSQD